MDAVQQKAIRESLVSNLILYYNETKGESVSKMDPDARETFASALDDMMEVVEIDGTCWSAVKELVFYDEYIKQREEAGTVTQFDLVRPGLLMGQFTDSHEYHKHCLRIGEKRREEGLPTDAEETKVCAECMKEKPLSKFKKRGGSCCSACNSKKYRERRNES